MIAAYVDQGTVYIAQSGGSSKFDSLSLNTMTHEDNSLVWKISGTANTLMAGCSNKMRDVDLLRYLKLFRGDLTISRLLGDILPKIKKRLKEYGRIDKDGDMASNYLIAKDDVCVFIRYNGTIQWIDSLYATEGLDYLQGWFELNSSLPPRDRLAKAVQAWMEEDGELPYPVMVTDTSTMKRVIYWE